MAIIYYINHTGYSDDNPHWGEYDDTFQVMETGKRWTKTFTSGVKHEAEYFLMDNFGLEWEREENV